MTRSLRSSHDLLQSHVTPTKERRVQRPLMAIAAGELRSNDAFPAYKCPSQRCSSPTIQTHNLISTSHLLQLGVARTVFAALSQDGNDLLFQGSCICSALLLLPSHVWLLRSACKF